jgi:hypothetical protein
VVAWVADDDVNRFVVLPSAAGPVRAWLDCADGCPLELLHADASPATTSTATAQVVQFPLVSEVERMTIQPTNRAAARRDCDIGALPPSNHQATAAYVPTEQPTDDHE